VLTAIAETLAAAAPLDNLTEGKTTVITIPNTAAGERFQQLLASALAQEGNYVNLFPLLTRVEPAAVINVASKFLT
jgi:hypothetical protein